MPVIRLQAADSLSRATYRVVRVAEAFQSGSNVGQLDKLFGILWPKHACIHKTLQGRMHSLDPSLDRRDQDSWGQIGRLYRFPYWTYS